MSSPSAAAATANGKAARNAGGGLGFVLGSRAHMQDAAMAKRSAVRNVLMHGFHVLVMMVVGNQIRDTQCGFKVCSRGGARVGGRCELGSLDGCGAALSGAGAAPAINTWALQSYNANVKVLLPPLHVFCVPTRPRTASLHPPALCSSSPGRRRSRSTATSGCSAGALMWSWSIWLSGSRWACLLLWCGLGCFVGELLYLTQLKKWLACAPLVHLLLWCVNSCLFVVPVFPAKLSWL